VRFLIPFTDRRPTHGVSELRQGLIPVIVRANRTLLCLDPKTDTLLPMARPQPLPTEDDSRAWNGVDLRAFGPSFARITGNGDGKDSSIPLPVEESKSTVTRTKRSRTRGKEPQKGKFSLPPLHSHLSQVSMLTIPFLRFTGKLRKSKSTLKKKRKVVVQDPESEEIEASDTETTDDEEDGEAPYGSDTSGDDLNPDDSMSIAGLRSARMCIDYYIEPTTLRAPSRTSDRLSAMRTTAPATTTKKSTSIAQSTPADNEREETEEDELDEDEEEVKPSKNAKPGSHTHHSKDVKVPQKRGTKRLREDSDSDVENPKKPKSDPPASASGAKVGPPMKTPKPPSGFKEDKVKKMADLGLNVPKPPTFRGTKRPLGDTSTATTDLPPAKKRPENRLGWDEEVKTRKWSQSTLNRVAILLIPDVNQICGDDWESWCDKSFIKPMLTQEGGMWSALRTFYLKNPKYHAALDEVLVSVAPEF
jgi:hypothetical protein